jgi:hypothetical protein
MMEYDMRLASEGPNHVGRVALDKNFKIQSTNQEFSLAAKGAYSYTRTLHAQKGVTSSNSSIKESSRYMIVESKASDNRDEIELEGQFAGTTTERRLDPMEETTMRVYEMNIQDTMESSSPLKSRTVVSKNVPKLVSPSKSAAENNNTATKDDDEDDDEDFSVNDMEIETRVSFEFDDISLSSPAHSNQNPPSLNEFLKGLPVQLVGTSSNRRAASSSLDEILAGLTEEELRLTDPRNKKKKEKNMVDEFVEDHYSMIQKSVWRLSLASTVRDDYSDRRAHRRR